MATPQKRHTALIPLSHDHHHGLMLCRKIQKGLLLGVKPNRIIAYARHFFSAQLEEHFREEEQILFPVLGNRHESIRRALAEHKHLKHFFFEETDHLKASCQIVRELDIHIRFEERILFNEIQDNATTAQLIVIARQLDVEKKIHPKETWDDQFWVSSA